MLKLLISGIVGLTLGIIGARYVLVGSALSLIPWGLAGLALGYIADNLIRSLTMGAFFGFWLAFSFMLAGYAGADPVVTKLVPFVIIGLVGAVCGIGLALVGYTLRRLLGRQSKHAASEEQ